MSMRKTYSATIEWFHPEAGILRLHEGADGKIGDPYVWCCTLHQVVPGVVVVKAVTEPIPLGGKWPFNDVQWDHGIRLRIHVRHDEGGRRTHWREIRQPKRRASA